MTNIDRRHFISAAGALAVSLATHADAKSLRQASVARVIIDNDFAGDPDGLFQLAHHLLCPAVKIPVIIGSHLPAHFGGPQSASQGSAKARELLKLMNMESIHSPIAGSQVPLASRDQGKPGLATAAIVREAMRDDAREPLFYAAGAGLTDLALACLAEPRIARRMKLIWIGGREHSDLAYPPPGPAEAEFNFAIDPIAAKVIFNESDIEIWQVPRNAYRQLLFSSAEIKDIAAAGPLGRYLKSELDGMVAKLGSIPGFPQLPLTEASVMGDSPLVTLTALVPPIQPDPSSSSYKVIPTPRLMNDGTYQDAPNGRPMRVYTSIDSGLTLRDMVSRFRRWDAAAPDG
nr:nucleoside hydrolase [Sphingomonas tagetis]